jgi:Spy/CpxP family protein refolding chaperone
MLELSCGKKGEVAMRRIAIWSFAAIVLAVAGVAIARANVWGWNGYLGFVARELNLSHEQKQQIRSMWQTERPAVSGLLQEFAAESKEMDQATVNANLDESKVEEIARRQGETLTRLLVEKEHFKAKIYTTVLNPEQRTKADALQSHWHERLDHIGKGME